MENAEYFKAKTEANSVNKQIIEEKKAQKLQVIESSDEPASKVKNVLDKKLLVYLIGFDWITNSLHLWSLAFSNGSNWPCMISSSRSVQFL